MNTQKHSHSHDHSHAHAHNHGACSCGCSHDHKHVPNQNHSHATATESCSCGTAHTHSQDSFDIECDCGHSHDDDDESHPRRRLILLALSLVITLFAAYAPIAEPLSVPLFIVAYLIAGAKVLIKAAKNIAKGDIFDENFLMGIASLGAVFLGDYTEAVAVMIFYGVGEYCQNLATSRSKKSIKSLLDLNPPTVRLLRGNEEIIVTPDQIAIGDIIRVLPGEKIGVDGIITKGAGSLGTAALTGESLPREVNVGDSVLSGSINLMSVIEIQAEKTAEKSTAQQIIELAAKAAKEKPAVQDFITKFARIYTPVVLLLALAVAVISPLLTSMSWNDSIYNALIFLVISCPCALVVSVPLSFFGAIGGASRNGILVRGANYLDIIRKIDTIVLDKTGTLTEGKFSITALSPVKDIDEKTLLNIAGIAEINSNHPIAQAISSLAEVNKEETASFFYKEIAGKGVIAEKGTETILAGNLSLMKEYNIAANESNLQGSLVYVAKNGKYLGVIAVNDRIKEDTPAAIAELRKLGVHKLVMLSGDKAENAQMIAKEIGIDEAYGNLLPQDKVEKFRELKEKTTGTIAFVGDGLNDAPVLSLADVGFAMGGLGSDGAIDAADVVITNDSLQKLPASIRLSRFTSRIVKQNIIFALGAKGVIMILGAMGIANMWLAIFADVGVALIAILNATRTLRYRP